MLLKLWCVSSERGFGGVVVGGRHKITVVWLVYWTPTLLCSLFMDLSSNGYGVVMESVDNRGWVGLRENLHSLSYPPPSLQMLQDNGGM